MKIFPDHSSSLPPHRLEIYTVKDLADPPAGPLQRLDCPRRFEIQVVAQVLPFRVNRYVLEDLIDWDQIPEDPIFQMTFPQREMLAEAEFNAMADLLKKGAEKKAIDDLAGQIRTRLNPHPAGQLELNRPKEEKDKFIDGLQHKYRETVLFFPSQGQTCHSFCTFCFRWAQFVGEKSLRFATREGQVLLNYLRRHQEVTDLLVTGGDPMVMRTRHLAAYLEPLLAPEFDHIQTIRIGTKALTYWPYRFLTEDDADALLRLLERICQAGKHVALMAHFNHWRELESQAVRRAIARLRETGAVIRSQGPILAHINDNPDVWASLWRSQVPLGIVPYYMFIERDTGPRQYFQVPLFRCWQIYQQAIQQVSGLGRTARGPSMSATPGKIEIQGVTEIRGEQVFALRFLQGRHPDWVQRPFFARFDAQATWMDQLKPAFGEDRFFFEE